MIYVTLWASSFRPSYAKYNLYYTVYDMSRRDRVQMRQTELEVEIDFAMKINKNKKSNIYIYIYMTSCLRKGSLRSRKFAIITTGKKDLTSICFPFRRNIYIHIYIYIYIFRKKKIMMKIHPKTQWFYLSVIDSNVLS